MWCSRVMKHRNITECEYGTKHSHLVLSKHHNTHPNENDSQWQSRTKVHSNFSISSSSLLWLSKGEAFFASLAPLGACWLAVRKYLPTKVSLRRRRPAGYPLRLSSSSVGSMRPSKDGPKRRKINCIKHIKTICNKMKLILLNHWRWAVFTPGCVFGIAESSRFSWSC